MNRLAQLTRLTRPSKRIAMLLLALPGLLGPVALNADAKPHLYGDHYAGNYDGSYDGYCGVDLLLSGKDRFDPAVQQQLLKAQMRDHRIIDEPRYLVIPYRDNGLLTESQIRYLEKLLRRQRAAESEQSGGQ